MMKRVLVSLALCALGVILSASVAGADPKVSTVRMAQPEAPKLADNSYANSPCPQGLKLSLVRTFDVRDYGETVKGPYSAKHMKPVDRATLLTKQQTIDAVLAKEKANPELIPAPFREQYATKSRDAAFRLYMARCEAQQPQLLMRASQDAAMAYLLGASVAAVHPVLRASFAYEKIYTCHSKDDCNPGVACDMRANECATTEQKALGFISLAEQDVNEPLAHGFLPLMTPEEVKQQRHNPDPDFSVRASIAFGTKFRCGGRALCSYHRMAGELLIWDTRYQGEGYPLANGSLLSESGKRCLAATGANDYDSCVYRCGTGAPSNEAACRSKCAASCQ